MSASNTFCGQGNHGMSESRNGTGQRVGIEKKTDDMYFYPGPEKHPPVADGLTTGDDCRGGRGVFPNGHRPHGLGDTSTVKGRGKR